VRPLRNKIPRSKSRSYVVLLEHGNVGLANDHFGLDAEVVGAFEEGQLSVDRSISCAPGLATPQIKRLI